MNLKSENKRTSEIEEVKSFKVSLKFDIDEDEQQLSLLLKSIKDKHFDSSQTLINVKRLILLNNFAIFDITQNF